MTESFDQQYYNVLKAIELAIKSVYDHDPDLEDYAVDKVLEGLLRVYTAEIRGRATPNLRLKALETTLMTRVRTVCDVHLGRDRAVMIGEDKVTVDEVIACLKRIRRSVKQMSSRGRRGYLDFIQDFHGE